jgi:hypothetical protein
MRKAFMPFVLSVGLIAVWAAPANAASTRAEYIAQVDPICQSFVAPENAAFRSYRKNDKRWFHLASSGSLKAWLKQRFSRSRAGARSRRLFGGVCDQSPPILD